MKECLLLTALVAMPIAAFRLAISLSPGPVAITLVVTAVGMTAGLVVGLLCWAITGARKGFVVGYGLAGIFCAVASYFLLTFNVYRSSDEEKQSRMTEREAAAQNSAPAPIRDVAMPD